MIQEFFSTFLIIANGPLEYKTAHFLSQKCTVIALDGAANHLHEIIPHFIMGDLDSIHENSKKKFEKLQIPIIKIEDQNLTDLEKAFQFVKNKGARQIYISSSLGGKRLDHHLNALHLLKKYYDKDCPIILISHNNLLIFLKDETFQFEGKKGDFCGFFGIPKAIVTTEGLKWDVKNWETEWGKEASCSNEVNLSLVTVEVQGDLLLFYPFSSLFKN